MTCGVVSDCQSLGVWRCCVCASIAVWCISLTRREHLELVTKVGDLHSQGRACSSLGSVYCLQGDFQAAVQWYTEVRLAELCVLQ